MAERSLDDLFIAVEGIILNHTHAHVETLVESVGATFLPRVTTYCTHLISDWRPYLLTDTVKGKKAAGLENCKTVTIHWLLECITKHEVVAEEPYLVLNLQKKDKKRKFREDDDEQNKTHKHQKDSQHAGSDTNVDALPHLNHLTTRAQKKHFHPLPISVYIGQRGLVYDATLSVTNSEKNYNKFYRVQIIQTHEQSRQYVCWTSWGRVGQDSGNLNAYTKTMSLEGAKKNFERKFKAKSGLKWEDRLDSPRAGKFVFIARDYGEYDDGQGKVEIRTTLTKAQQSLLAFIFTSGYFQNTLSSFSYDALQFPLGKLSQRALKNGVSVLKKLARVIADPMRPDWRDKVQELSNRYLSIIPHDFGRRPVPVLAYKAEILRELELVLEALADMDSASETMEESKLSEFNALDLQFQTLELKEMTALEHSSVEFCELANYLNNSRGATHRIKYTVIDIFRIEHHGEEDRFQSSPFARIEKSDRRLLLHGSSSWNFAGILRQGLRIAPPEAPSHGAAFGEGAYLADMSSKSANYSLSLSEDKGMLLLCDTELGESMLELQDGDRLAAEKAEEEGKFAAIGKGRVVHAGWKDAEVLGPHMKGVRMPDTALGQIENEEAGQGTLQYNEYIVYDEAQIRLRYLFHLQFL